MDCIDCGNWYLVSGDCDCGATIAVPHTTQEAVIFTSKYDVFDRYYDPKDTDYKVSNYQVDEVLTFIETTLKKHFMWINCFIKFYIGTILFGIITFFFLWLLNLVQLHFRPLLLVVLILIYVVWECIHQKEISNVKEICQQYLDHRNHALARSGLRWKIPEQFPRWIELHNDWRNDPRNLPTVPEENYFNAPSQLQDRPSQTQSQGYEMVNYSSNHYKTPQKYQEMTREL